MENMNGKANVLRRTKSITRLSLTIAVLLCALSAEAKKENKGSSKPSQISVEAVMKVLSVKDQPSTPAPKENFTGSVRVTRLIQGKEPSNLTCSSVEFQAGARSKWHTHPKGQLLIVSDGAGLIQEWGHPVRKIKTGDVIWTPPGVKHWHGAAPNNSMIHTAVTETLEGKAVEWLERVPNEQYYSEAQ
jgi:quercetin dioxygenase-like cupin family protein